MPFKRKRSCSFLWSTSPVAISASASFKSFHRLATSRTRRLMYVYFNFSATFDSCLLAFYFYFLGPVHKGSFLYFGDGPCDWALTLSRFRQQRYQAWKVRYQMCFLVQFFYLPLIWATPQCLPCLPLHSFLMDEIGHLKLVDFGSSKRIRSQVEMEKLRSRESAFFASVRFYQSTITQ